MLNPTYTIRKFSENFSETTTINQFIELAKQQAFDLEVDLVHRIPSILTWYPSIDSFSGEYNLLVYPRLTIEGETFTPPKMVPMYVPSGIVNCKCTFLDALKEAISGFQQVWN